MRQMAVVGTTKFPSFGFGLILHNERSST